MIVLDNFVDGVEHIPRGSTTRSSLALVDGGHHELDALVDTHRPHLVFLHDQGSIKHALDRHASQAAIRNFLEGLIVRSR